MSSAVCNVVLCIFAVMLTFSPQSTESQVIETSSCGQSSANFRPRIVSGEVSPRGWWPWQIAIYKDRNFHCGGALLSRRWVLTAAHCFYHGRYFMSDTDLYQIKAGDHNLSVNETSQQEIPLQRIFVHPRFKQKGTPYFDGDLALVKLSQEVKLGGFVRTVCLPEKSEGDLAIPNTVGTVAGWGVTRPLKLDGRVSLDDVSKVLRHATFTIKSDQLCKNKSGIQFNSTTAFCAGDGKGNSDSCQGDSGGAFVREIRNSKWIVIGVVSWGNGCAQKDQYGYYTRIHPFLDWIKETMETEDKIRYQSCTRTNRQPSVCLRPCDPAQDDCKGNRHCVCDGDCGYSCVKRDLHCPRLTLDNGWIRHNNDTLGSVARYRCNTPYRLVGSKKTTCRGNGQWDGEKPTCSSTCSSPTLPRGSTIIHPPKQEKYKKGSVVLFGCKKGFYLAGKPIIKCLGSTWTQRKFRCVGFCPDLLEISNGRVIDTSPSIHQASVEFRCNENFRLVGRSRLECIDGRWNGKLPFCQTTLCSTPTIPSNSYIIYPPTTQVNYTHGTHVFLACRDGHYLKGSSIMVCNQTVWIKGEFSCIASCPVISSIKNGIITHATLRDGGEVEIKCRPGYTLVGPSKLRCIEGKWNDSLPLCKAKSCGNPGVPVNGKRNSHIFTFKSRVDFDCNRGYKLVGHKYMICQANQRWSGNLPTCKQIDCGVLPTPVKAEKIHETHTKVDGVVRFKCKDKGYEISGSEIRTCGSNGLWSGSPTSCDIITCGDPGTPLNGQQADVKNGYNYGGSVKFTCKDNYTLSGASEIFCEEKKDWSSPTPKCWASCPDPGVPGNGSRSGADFRHAKSVTFSCKEDYELEGDATISCNNGDWTSTTPHCKVISCKDPGSPLHGRQSKVTKNFAVGGFVRFKCSENYTMVGKGKLTCLKSKMWNEEIPKCFASCPDPGHPENGQTIGRVFDHNSIVEFECLGDRLLQGSSQAKCNNGQWDQALPTCRDCGTGLPLGMESRKIPNTAIKASSHKAQHPAHHGRLGGDNYWCSEEGKVDFIEISLPKKYKITGARIQLKSKYTDIKSIILKGQILKEWWNFYYKKPSYNEEVEQIKGKHPFIAQSVQIRVLKRESICLRAEVYGCRIPRGCIMPGSVVLIKQNDRYHRGYVGGYMTTNSVEVSLPGKAGTIIMTRADVVQDEKPDVHELVIGKLVLGEDVTTPGLIRKGKIEQITDSVCTIKTNDETWKSDLNDIRIVKKSPFCS